MDDITREPTGHPRRGHQSAIQLGPPSAGPRHHGRRFRGARRLPPAAPFRLGRAQAALEASDLGALLLFDDNNIRYVTSTKIGEWARDKLSRWTLLLARRRPILWDFGSAAVHHRLYSPWLKPENCRAGLVGLRGTVDPGFGLMKHHAEEMASLLRSAGVAGMPVGVDIVEPPMMFELQKAGLKVKDGQQVMLEAREVKIGRRDRAAEPRRSDGRRRLRPDQRKAAPGVRENDIVAIVNEYLYRHGSDDVEAINAISGERGNPHPHNFTDRLIRPGDQVFFDILQAFMGYRTCYYRTFNVGRATPAQRDAYKKCREWLDHGDRPDQAGRHHRRGRAACGRRRRISDSRTNCRRSACNSATASVSTSRTADHQPRGLAGAPDRDQGRAWCSRWRPIARRGTAIPPPASRKRWW